MAKISELPEATVVNSDDLAVIVQGGITKRASCEILVPKPPEVTVDAELSETSENPVQNKAVKGYIDETAKRIPTDITLADGHLQLIANGEAVGNGVYLPKGYGLFNDITLTEDVTQVERSLDDNGKPFKIKKIFLLFVGKCTPGISFPLLFRLNNGTIYQMYKTLQVKGTTGAFWIKSEKIADGIYRSEYPSGFVGTNSTKVSDDGTISNQGLADAAAPINSNIFFNYPPKSEGYATGTKWHFGVANSSEARLLAGSRIIVMGVRE